MRGSCSVNVVDRYPFPLGDKPISHGIGRTAHLDTPIAGSDVTGIFSRCLLGARCRLVGRSGERLRAAMVESRN